jgi:hypothetical protein
VRYFKAICRLTSLACYGLSLVIAHHVQPIAAKAYNDLCASQGITFGEGPSINALGITLLVLAFPLLLARSRILAVVNLGLGLITMSGAIALLRTAGDIPYECFTTMGTYEDNTSGLAGFGMWVFYVALLSYVFLLVDLAIWCISKLIQLKRTLRPMKAV